MNTVGTVGGSGFIGSYVTRKFLQEGYVVHCGTPFQLALADPQRDMYEPTVKGTEHFLEAAGQVG